MGIVKHIIFVATISILCICCSDLVIAQSAKEEGGLTFSWDANTETDLAGYRLYYGLESGQYTDNITLDAKTIYTLRDLTPGVKYYVALTAFDFYDNESGYSDEVIGEAKDIVFPDIPQNFREVTTNVNNQ
jgi:hypothetical protein